MEEILGYELPDRPDSAAAFDEVDTDDNGSVDWDEFLAAGELLAEELRLSQQALGEIPRGIFRPAQRHRT